MKLNYIVTLHVWNSCHNVCIFMREGESTFSKSNNNAKSSYVLPVLIARVITLNGYELIEFYIFILETKLILIIALHVWNSCHTVFIFMLEKEGAFSKSTNNSKSSLFIFQVLIVKS